MYSLKKCPTWPASQSRSLLLATWCQEPTHWKRTWCWERLKAGREGGDRGWGGWMASPTWRTGIWANSRRWWRTGKPGVLLSTGWQRIGHDLTPEQEQNRMGPNQVEENSGKKKKAWRREATSNRRTVKKTTSNVSTASLNQQNLRSFCN